MSTKATAMSTDIRFIVSLPAPVWRMMNVTKSPNAATNARLAAKAILL